MRIDIDDEIYLDEIRDADASSYVKHLVEKEIYDNTLRIPHPYTMKDAQEWLAICRDRLAKHGEPSNLAIRKQDGELIGGIGFFDFEEGGHAAEIGYWLAKPYWGRGIMTRAVAAFCDFIQRRFGLVRITANVFEFNARSGRVLEKAGFQLEGRLRKAYRKDGRIFDGLLYAKIY